MLLNVLWDGGEMAIDRRSKPSFVLRGRRLTFVLMVQPEALRGVLERASALLERAGTLPRGTGFIARFLIAWPGSTQGTRAYRPAPEAMPQVALFGARRRLADLDTPPSLAAASRLDFWLRNEAIANDTDRVPTKRIYGSGRNARSELCP